MSQLLTFTDRGIYCPAGDFYIDPWRPVDRALITHGHADHARPRMQRYLATQAAAPVIRYRLGEDIDLQTTPFGSPIRIGDATVSFHPAGHVPGSAQIRVEVGGEVWVVSGDYKTIPDGLSEPFEPVACHTFISECTFGLPVFNWLPQSDVIADINTWWQANREAGKTSAIGAYALGKAQRILANIDTTIGPVLTHSAIENTNDVLRAQGIDLPGTVRLTGDLDHKAYPGALIIATPSALNSNWPRGFGPVSTAFASGWMALRGVRRRRSVDRGFILSDHADWPGLNEAIKATGAERIFVTHGYTVVFRRWLEEAGYQAEIVETEFEGETADAADENATAGSDSGEDAAS
ncbi:MAG: ligase-associated DNA damage response exonuclease [Hyphomicrobiaceae bacterium]